jgi:hypothetical protein
MVSIDARIAVRQEALQPLVDQLAIGCREFRGKRGACRFVRTLVPGWFLG